MTDPDEDIHKGPRMKLNYLILLVLTMGFAHGADLGLGSRDGEIRATADGFVAWDAERRQWLDPETFWESFAARGRGRSWPASPDYPPYVQVKEHDTFLVQLESGPCLMYFFHTRWRRANDVWRWGDRFNQYGGCPHVFE